MKNFIIAAVALIIIYFTLPFFGIDSFNFFMSFIEWSTKFVLPWIILYWLIRMVKALERRGAG
jgi:hypothetical protein